MMLHVFDDGLNKVQNPFKCTNDRDSEPPVEKWQSNVVPVQQFRETISVYLMCFNCIQQRQQQQQQKQGTVFLDQGLEPVHNWSQREKTIQREWSHNWAVTIGRLTGNWNSETLHAGFWMDGEICFSLFFQFWGVVPLGVTIPSLDGFEDQEQVRYGAAVLVSWIQRLWIT